MDFARDPAKHGTLSDLDMEVVCSNLLAFEVRHSGFFAITLFLSAALLFMVQPMIGKMLLPSLGGTPAVWNTCMVFFQAVLLLGYGYALRVTKLPRQRTTAAPGPRLAFAARVSSILAR
ncbi:MAG: hypothetical protein U0744_14700 [Gemmataceae bacterium]